MADPTAPQSTAAGFLQGNRTYIVGWATVILGLAVTVWNSWDAATMKDGVHAFPPGACPISPGSAALLIAGGLATITGRAALANKPTSPPAADDVGATVAPVTENAGSAPPDVPAMVTQTIAFYAALKAAGVPDTDTRRNAVILDLLKGPTP